MRLAFTRKDPATGYVTNNILIPRSTVNELMVKNLLTFQVGIETKIEEGTGQAIGTQPKVHELWDETEHHLIVPREFFSDQEMPQCSWVKESLSFPEIDLPNTIVPRETQVKALVEMERYRTGTVNIGCGKGKTVLALLYAIRRRRPVIVIVNAGALMRQWQREIRDHIGDVPVGIINGDQFEWKGYPIVLATVQTLANRAAELGSEFRRYFGVAFFDEGHHLSAPHFVKAAPLFFGDRFSLTATATRADGLECIYQYHLGPIIYQDLEQDLIPDTTFHALDWQPDQEQLAAMIDSGGTNNWGLFCVMLASVGWRNQYIIEQVVPEIEEGRDILVLAHTKEHVRALFDEYPYEGASFITAEDVKDFDERLTLLESTNPVFATFQLAREALDKKSLAGLHICSSFASSNDLQQSFGRTQRADDKLNPNIHVYGDTRIKMSARQCNDLRTYLKAIGYPFENLKVEIDL